MISMIANVWATPESHQSSEVEVEMDEGRRSHGNPREFDICLVIEVVVGPESREGGEVD